jgi:hypothetical protein
MKGSMHLMLGIGIGTVLGMAVSTLADNLQKRTQSNYGRGFNQSNRNIFRNQNYEFGQEYAISGSKSGGEKILYGHGQNYGISGYGSGISDSQTNINRKNNGNGYGTKQGLLQ